MHYDSAQIYSICMKNVGRKALVLRVYVSISVCVFRRLYDSLLCSSPCHVQMGVPIDWDAGLCIWMHQWETPRSWFNLPMLLTMVADLINPPFYSHEITHPHFIIKWKSRPLIIWRLSSITQIHPTFMLYSSQLQILKYTVFLPCCCAHLILWVWKIFSFISFQIFFPQQSFQI